MATKDKKYVNGIFFKKTWEDENDAGNFLASVGVKKEEFIKNIQSLPPDSRGFINLSFGRQKADPNKYSLWLDEYVRTSQANSPTNSGAGTTDDLPFAMYVD